MDGTFLMSIKNQVVSRFILFLTLLSLASCASKGSNEQQAEIIHLTSPKNQPQASTRNPRQDGNVTVSTIDTQTPLIPVESSDGLPPDSTALVSPPTAEPSQSANQHQVLAGDTLYSIAQQYGTSYEALALANNLDANYTIFLGQTLQLDTSEVPVEAPKKAKKTVHLPAKKPTKKAAPKTTKPAQKNVKIYKDRPVSNQGGASWIWPVLGTPKVLRPFSNARGENVKGLDIAGKDGDTIIATSDGIVVYAGDELSGYGNLVIISHGERYISAYAHNQKVLAKEGEKVKQGQKIAVMGSTGSDQTKLFFQIRKDSQPLDPIIYLPQR